MMELMNDELGIYAAYGDIANVYAREDGWFEVSVNGDFSSLLINPPRDAVTDWDYMPITDYREKHALDMVAKAIEVGLPWEKVEDADKVEYLACDACSAVLANGDDSHIEDDDISTVTATVEAMGWVTQGDEFRGGYFRCYVCGYDEISGHVWYGV